MRLQHFQKRLVPPARRLPIVPSVTRGRRVNPRLERAYEADVPVPRSLVKDEKPFRRRGRHYEALWSLQGRLLVVQFAGFFMSLPNLLDPAAIIQLSAVVEIGN